MNSQSMVPYKIFIFMLIKFQVADTTRHCIIVWIWIKIKLFLRNCILSWTQIVHEEPEVWYNLRWASSCVNSLVFFVVFLEFSTMLDLHLLCWFFNFFQTSFYLNSGGCVLDWCQIMNGDKKEQRVDEKQEIKKRSLH